MSFYNPVERTIARTLSRFPFLKSFAKLIYSRLVFLKNKKKHLKKTLSLPFLYTKNGANSFFGYYDKSPENSKGQVLACITPTDTKKNPLANSNIELAVFESDGSVLVQFPVSTYNWQQGCRAHWLDDDLFIHNDFDFDIKRYVSKVYSIAEKKHIKQFDYPVQDSFGKEFFISLNYRRLMALRPDYGYRNIPALDHSKLAELQNDGLWVIDFHTGAVERFISLVTICQLNYDAAFENAKHKVNHVMISPNGSKFIFMHRYLINGQRFDRLILCDSETANLRLIANFDMVSHCFWADDNTILGYMRGPNNKDGYWLIDLETDRFSELPCKELTKYGDGHPHVHGDWFITDTYPDKARMQHLLWCNWKTGEVKEIGEFFHGFGFNGESRCDLHPRLSYDGKRVYFDSVFSGQRQLYKMELPD